MALEMSATAIVKTVTQLLRPDTTIYHFEGELSGYNPNTKKEETVSNSDMDMHLQSISFLIT
jgi:hypothetical protein